MKIFLSKSKAGSHLDIPLIEERLGELDIEIVEWSDFLSVEENYKVLLKCDKLLIIPPTSDNVLGKGQTNIYQNFSSESVNNLIISNVTKKEIFVGEIDSINVIDHNWQTEYSNYSICGANTLSSYEGISKNSFKLGDIVIYENKTCFIGKMDNNITIYKEKGGWADENCDYCWNVHPEDLQPGNELELSPKLRKLRDKLFPREYKVGDWVYLSVSPKHGNGMSLDGSDDGIYQLLKINESKNPTGHLLSGAHFMFKRGSLYYNTHKLNIIRIANKEEIPIREWSEGTYVVTKEITPFGAFKVGEQRDKPEGTIFKLEKDSFEDTLSVPNEWDYWVHKKYFKWFATEEEAKEFAKTLVIPKKSATFPEKWVIKQNTSQKVCDWFNDKFNTSSFLQGGIKYLSSTGTYENDIPEDFTEIILEQFEKYVFKEVEPKFVECSTKEEWVFVKEHYGHEVCKHIFPESTCIAINTPGSTWRKQAAKASGGVISFKEWCEFVKIDVPKLGIKYVYTPTKKQWDFVCEKLGYNDLSYPFSDRGTICINLTGETYSGAIAHKRKKYLTFEEWLEKTGYKLPITPYQALPMPKGALEIELIKDLDPKDLDTKGDIPFIPKGSITWLKNPNYTSDAFIHPEDNRWGANVPTTYFKSKFDLIEGEIYFTTYEKSSDDHIFMFKSGSLERCENFCIIRGEFTKSPRFFGNTGKYANNLKLATSYQKKWLNTCIKQDKFIPESALPLYDERGNLLERGCSFEIGDLVNCIRDCLDKDTNCSFDKTVLSNRFIAEIVGEYVRLSGDYDLWFPVKYFVPREKSFMDAPSALGHVLKDEPELEKVSPKQDIIEIPKKKYNSKRRRAGHSLF